MIKGFFILLFSLAFKVVAIVGFNSPLFAESLQIDGDFTYWCEMRPENKGLSTLVRHDAILGEQKDMTPADFNARTFVHEYGGGAFTVSNGIIYVSNGNDGAIYVIKPGFGPRRLTAQKTEKSETRFADMHLTPYGLVAIGELHESGMPVQNFLALINTTNGSYKKLAWGYDFYSSPAISADGKKIAWICWNHPNMPWTNSELWVANLHKNGTLKAPKQICGKLKESIFQPQWSKDGTLYFVTDRDRGWWNLHRYVDGHIENVCPMEAEVAEPLWTFELSTYAFLGNQIVFTYNREGRWHLAILNPETKQWKEIHREGVYIHQLRGNGDFVRFLEQYSDRGEALAQINESPDIPSRFLFSDSSRFEEGNISIPIHIAFPSNGRAAYGFFYPPHSSTKLALGKKPPLLVMIHGGPTAQATSSLQFEHQYWTSRGFALLDVNYGGSTGYGRSYRELLNHQWGVVDVEDCVNGARFLVREGLVDGNKLAIRGGSAGGFTTLAALAFQDTFDVGASYYGVADITALTRDTHKFEKNYAEQLVGKYPKEKQLWESRSPIHSVDQITAPLIIFQGEDDPIVPKNQSIMIFEALHEKGVCVELYLYPGEGHGFRQAKHIAESLSLEAEFYLKVFKSKESKTLANV